MMVDADRDQFEVFVPASEQFPSYPSMEDGRVSSTSMSIILDRSRDSLLDQSVCSNPRDESTILAHSSQKSSTMATISADSRKRRAEQSEKASSTSSDEDEEALPPPPLSSSGSVVTPAAEHASEVVAESVVAGIKELQTSPEMEPIQRVTLVTRELPRREEEQEQPSSIQPVRPISSNTERIASFVYGYGGIGSKGSDSTPKNPLIWSSSRLRAPFEEDNKENAETQRRAIYSSQISGKHHEPIHSISSVHSRYNHTNAPYETWRDNSNFGNKSNMDLLPPSEAPPPPPAQQQPKSHSDVHGGDGDHSRDDLMSEGHRSRATIREIPIQRSASAFAPSIGMSSLGGAGGAEGLYNSSRTAIPLGGSTTSAYTTTKYQPLSAGVGPHEEYYRREVLTRTLVTRSTEALAQAPPLSRSSPIEHLRPALEPSRGTGDEVSEEYWYKYSRNVEEEERRIKDNQAKRKKEEEERRLREEEKRRRWEQHEMEQLERLRREREKMEKEFEYQIMEREKVERDRVEKDRLDREAAEARRRQEWERLERERRQYEENELEKRRQLERLEKERLERERLERERLELERLERERLQQEKLEQERVERERVERERIEIERLEIERIERIKREQKEKEQREKERQREEAERLERERLEAERLHRERIELERRERELIEIARREAEQRDRERREDELREQRRRQQEQRERELLEQAEREAAEREMQRKLKEKIEQERLDHLRREQEKLEFERIEAERRERQRQEEERREQELLEAQQRARERRDQERIDEQRREFLRQEEERREQERRQRERIEAQERERQRMIEEQKERERVAALEAAAAERRAQRIEEERLQRSRVDLERRAEELKEIERREAERREKERTMSRLEEERRLAELRDLERRNAEQRDAERREAAEREANRRKEDRRSHDRLDLIVKEREERERWETEKRRVIAEREAEERKRQALTSKETLERLTRKPYYSRENLSNIGLPEVTTKVERQIIERVDRTLWTSDDLRHPGNGHPPSLLLSNTSPTSEDNFGGGGAHRERIFNPRDDDFRRGGSTRTSKYKARIEKARKEFLSTDPNAPQYDPLSDRFRKSTEDLGRKIEYRGPLLQKFHSGELLSRAADLDLPYSRMGPSPYDQRHETNLDDVHRSKSVLDYSPGQRYSRKDVGEPESSEQHSRSKSADYLLDRRIREGVAAPENELQKTIGDIHHYPERGGLVSEHEYSERFRKSVEKLHVPDWYREYGGADRITSGYDPLGGPATTTTATSGVFSGPGSNILPTYGRQISPTTSYELRTRDTRYGLPSSQPWSYTNPIPAEPTPGSLRSPTSPVGGIAFPAGMFDKYKNEIEDLRRSRTSLHQIPATSTPQEHTKVFAL